MSKIDAIEEEQDHRARRSIAWGHVQNQCFNPPEITGDAILKKDLSCQEIDLLDRTKIAAESALAQTDLASPTDRIRDTMDVSKERPAGSNAVADAAQSTGLVQSPPLQSVFDLSGSMTRKAPAAQPTNDLSENTSITPEAIQKNYLRLVLDLHESMEQMITDSADRFSSLTRRDMEELGKLREEKVKAIEDYTREVANKESWATIETLARYLAYASSVAIGSMLVSSGAWVAGYLLIAAGGTGLVGSVGSDLGLWTAFAAHLDKSQETQQHIVQSIEFATTLSALGLGLLGTSMASPTHAPTAFAWMAAALSTSSKLGESWSEKKYEYIMAELEKLDHRRFDLQEGTKATSKQMQETLQMAKQITQEVEKIISDSEIAL
jgi:hypothetical protein